MPVVGVLGAGQLGRMLALAGAPMGIRCRFLDPAAASAEPCPAAALGEVIAADFGDQGALDRLAAGCAAVTYEFENVPAEAVEYLAQRIRVWPPPLALRTAQDRLLEKQAFASCGVPTNRTAPWDPATQTREDLVRTLDAIGLPAVLKSRRMGYDGRGQGVLRAPEGLDALLARLPRAPLLVEEFVPFGRELSIVAVRSGSGEFRAYPLVENVHKDGILRTTIAPAPGVPPALQARAESHVRSLMDRLGYVGVMALELFEVASSAGPTLLANEIAPRVHNTGHWTIEAARTSQFENHLRAILGLPLGETSAVGHSVMVNLIGVNPDPAAILAIPGTSFHWYGKAVKPGRKVGHVTAWGENAADVATRAADIERLIKTPPR